MDVNLRERVGGSSMKRFIALLLSISMLGSLPACAESIQNISEIKLDLSVKEQQKQVETAEVKKEIAPKIITCDENSTDEMCKAIELTKTEIKLRSYLKDGGILMWRDESGGGKENNKAYVYSIKNNSNKTIFIKEIQSKSPYSLMKEAINLRIFYQLIGVPVIILSAITIVGPIFIIFTETKSIILAPFRDTAALFEAKQFKKINIPGEINPGMDFKAKLFIAGDKTKFTFEDKENNQEYSIIK